MSFGEKMNSGKRKLRKSQARVKVALAALSAGTVVAMGVLTAAFSDTREAQVDIKASPAGTTVTGGFGATIKMAAPPSQPATSKAVPSKVR